MRGSTRRPISQGAPSAWSVVALLRSPPRPERFVGSDIVQTRQITSEGAMAKRCPACMTDAKDHSRAPADDAAAQDCNARLSRPVAVKHGFQIFLLAEDWFIYTWDAVAHRVLFYNTELWGEWCY